MNKVQIDREKTYILYIGDDTVSSEVLRQIFSPYYTFKEIGDGAECVQKARIYQSKLNAILVGMKENGQSAISVLESLHAAGITDIVPIFFIMPYDKNEIARMAYDLGVMDVIKKPFNSYVVLRRVQMVIELFQSRVMLNARIQDQETKLQESEDMIHTLHRGTIEALVSAIEFRDMESGEHTNRIYTITKHILTHTEMGVGYSAEEIENMAQGAIMHDVGKIAISDMILNKPGRLTKDEYEIMKYHTIRGAELIDQLKKFQSHESYTYAYDIARHHHERWDGNGYPDKLVGDEITVWSQVVSIADVYDALISKRVYKEPFEPEVVVEMIRNGECGVFNPKLLECFFQVELDLRQLYINARLEGIKSGEIEEARRGMNLEKKREYRKISPAHQAMDMLLLMSAVQSAYSMIISANLTKNTYYMIDYERFNTKAAPMEGAFDDLIFVGSQTIPESHRQQFINLFSRESLLRSYAEGITSVTLEHPQFTDDGSVCWVSTSVLLMEDTQSGDIMEITLSRYLETDK